jgi:uncharacterized membrane protein YidH (DUF202 family)
MVESRSIDQVAGQVNVLERQTPLLKVDDSVNESLIVGEVQLVLAEKRTSLAALRTGIAVLVLPLSVLSLLIATSRYYDFFRVLYLVIPLFVLNAALAALGAYLIVRAVIRMHHQDILIKELKKRHPMIAPFID